MLELRDSLSFQTKSKSTSQVASTLYLNNTRVAERRLVRYSEHFVQCEFAQFGAHGGLCQLGDGIFWILDAVAGLGTNTDHQPTFLSLSDQQVLHLRRFLKAYLKRVEDP